LTSHLNSIFSAIIYLTLIDTDYWLTLHFIHVKSVI